MRDRSQRATPATRAHRSILRRSFHHRLLFSGIIAVLLIFIGVLVAIGPDLRARAVAGLPGDGIRIEYDRVVRKHTPSTLLVSIERRRLSDTRLRLVLSGDYHRVVQVHSTTLPVLGPTSNGILFGADIGDGDATLSVAIHVNFLKTGLVRGQVGTLGGQPIDLVHVVYP